MQESESLKVENQKGNQKAGHQGSTKIPIHFLDGIDGSPQQYLEKLGLPLGATNKEIKRAFWRLAMKHHPDRGGKQKVYNMYQAAYNALGGKTDLH